VNSVSSLSSFFKALWKREKAFRGKDFFAPRRTNYYCKISAIFVQDSVSADRSRCYHVTPAIGHEIVATLPTGMKSGATSAPKKL